MFEFSKNEDTWRAALGHYDAEFVPPEEYSTDNGTDGTARIWLDPDRDPNVVVVNRDEANRELNLNWFDNRWNRNYWFVGVRPRYSLHFFPAYFGGEVCFMS